MKTKGKVLIPLWQTDFGLQDLQEIQEKIVAKNEPIRNEILKEQNERLLTMRTQRNQRVENRA